MGFVLVILFYLVLIGGFLGLVVFLYLRSVLSRRGYRCPHCGERLSVELMQATFCNVCGAPLRVEDDDVTT